MKAYPMLYWKDGGKLRSCLFQSLDLKASIDTQRFSNRCNGLRAPVFAVVPTDGYTAKDAGNTKGEGNV